MATAKRRVFRPEPYLDKDVDNYMDFKIDKYINHLDEIDLEGVYQLEYDTDIPTKEELLNGVDQSNCAGGEGSYRLSKRIRMEGDNRLAEQLKEERLAEQLKQEEYEKTDKYKLEQIMQEKAAAEEDRVKRTKQEKAAAEEDKLYWEEYDKQEPKAISRSQLLKELLPGINALFGSMAETPDRSEGMTASLLGLALREIARDEEVILLRELDEQYMRLECLPLKSFVKETRAGELKKDAEVNRGKLTKLLREGGGAMPVGRYTHGLELLHQYTNRVMYINELMGDTDGDY